MALTISPGRWGKTTTNQMTSVRVFSVFRFVGVHAKGVVLCESREVLHGVGADGVGVKFPIFAVNCCCLPLSSRRSREKGRKRGKLCKKGENCVKKGFSLFLLVSPYVLLFHVIWEPQNSPPNEVTGIYIYMLITSFDGPLLGFKKPRRRGKDEKIRQGKAKMRKKRKH